MLTFCWVSSLTKPPGTETLLLAVSDVLADWYTSASYWERPDSAMLWWRKCETACLCTCAVVGVRESTVWVFWVANKFLFITNIPEKSVRIFWNQTPIVLKALHQAEPISPSVNLIVKCVKGYRGGGGGKGIEADVKARAPLSVRITYQDSSPALLLYQLVSPSGRTTRTRSPGIPKFSWNFLKHTMSEVYTVVFFWKLLKIN